MVSQPAESELLRLIPLLPLLAALFHGLVIGVLRRRSSRRTVIALSCGSVALAFLTSCWAFVELVQLPEGGRLLVDDVYTWIGAGVGDRVFTAELAFQLDPLSAVMILIVTGVGFLGAGGSA